jgi:hypothetical protein
MFMQGLGSYLTGSKHLPQMAKRRKSTSAIEKLISRRASIRPEEFPVGSAQSRAAVRELLVQSQKRIQLIFACPEGPLNLEESRCFRSACPDGTIIEVVELTGNSAELSESELEKFILSHPIV